MGLKRDAKEFEVVQSQCLQATLTCIRAKLLCSALESIQVPETSCIRIESFQQLEIQASSLRDSSGRRLGRTKS